MTYREKLDKTLKNIDHLKLELLKLDNEIVIVNNGGGLTQVASLDFFANFCWCPFCDEAIGDEPFCPKCGDVSGKIDDKFYKYGVVKEHYEFKITSRNDKNDCLLLYTRKELNEYTSENNIEWDGTLEHLKNIYIEEMGLKIDIEAIDEWEV